MSDIQTNKQLAIHWLNLVSKGDIDEMYRSTSPMWRMHGGPPDLPTGHEGLRALFGTIGPVDQQWTIDDVIAEGDKVVVRATNNCVQENFLGIPAAGIRQIFTATFTFRVADGLVMETWRNADDLGRLLQLGAQIVPPPDQREG